MSKGEKEEDERKYLRVSRVVEKAERGERLFRVKFEEKVRREVETEGDRSHNEVAQVSAGLHVVKDLKVEVRKVKEKCTC